MTTQIDQLVYDACARVSLPSPPERKAIRERAGLTQDQIARALATHAAVVSRWELGATPRGERCVIYARLLARLAEAFPPE